MKTIGIGLPAIDLAPDLGGVWVVTGGFGTILRIDSELGAVAEQFKLGDPGTVQAARSFGVGEGRIWVGAFDGLVSIDPDSGEEQDRVDLGQSAALQIAVGSGAVSASLPRCAHSESAGGGTQAQVTAATPARSRSRSPSTGRRGRRSPTIGGCGSWIAGPRATRAGGAHQELAPARSRWGFGGFRWRHRATMRSCGSTRRQARS